MKKYINYIIGAFCVIFLILIDRITKYYAVVNLKGNGEYSLIDGVFSLYYVENSGAAFGILGGKQIFLYIVTIAITVFVIFFYIKLPKTKRFIWLRIISVLIVSGAIGNLIDRLTQQYVIDFFYFKAINFPVFNVADIYVTVGAISLIILLLFYYKENDFKQIFKQHKTKSD